MFDTEFSTFFHPCLPIEVLSPVWFDYFDQQYPQRVSNLPESSVGEFGLSAYLFQVFGHIIWLCIGKTVSRMGFDESLDVLYIPPPCVGGYIASVSF
jgi:hypothetical protein